MSNEKFKNMNVLSNRIRWACKNTGLNQKAFAEKIGIAPGYLSEIMSEKKIPSVKLLKLISQAGQVNYEWLAHGSGDIKEGIVAEAPVYYGGYIEAVAAMMREMDEETQKDIFLSVQKEKLLRTLLSEREGAKNANEG